MAHIVLTATEREKRVGYHHHATQQTANDLPQWHVGRRLRTSEQHKVLNALAGKQIGEWEEADDSAFLDGFLSWVETDAPDVVLKYQVPANTELGKEFNSKNMLLNGAFKVRTNDMLLADNWLAAGDVSKGTGFISNNCATLDPRTQQSTLTQTQYLDIPAGTSLCASIYYRIPQWISAGAAAPNTHALVLQVRYTDNTTATVRARLDAHTFGAWSRVYVTTTLEKPVDWISLQISTQATAGFPITQLVSVDACMLEFSTMPSQWEPSRRDYPHYFNQTVPSPIEFEAEHPIYYVDNFDDFWRKAIPTRAGVTLARTNTIDPPVPVGTVRLVDYDNRTWWAEFDIARAGLGVRKIGITCPGEVYAEYDLAYWNYRGYYDLSFSYTVLALAWLHGQLWAVTRNTVLGETKLMLSILQPRVPSPEPTYLEVIAAIELSDVPLAVDRAEFRYDDQQHIYLSDGVNEYRTRLYYDYFMFDAATYMAYFREEYSQLVLINKSRK